MSDCDHKNTYCPCAVEDIKNRDLAQARAELEEVKHQVLRLENGCRGDRASECPCCKSKKEAEAKLADAHKPGFSHWKKRAEEAESQAAELRKALENIRSQQWQERHDGGPEDATPKERGLLEYCGRVCCMAQEALEALPASVQARAEREQERDEAVAAIRDITEGCPVTADTATFSHGDIESAPPYQAVVMIHVAWTRWKRLTAAIARLAALDSAQKGERGA